MLGLSLPASTCNKLVDQPLLPVPVTFLSAHPTVAVSPATHLLHLLNLMSLILLFVICPMEILDLPVPALVPSLDTRLGPARAGRHPDPQPPIVLVSPLMP